jgi:hypothetical protein
MWPYLERCSTASRSRTGSTGRHDKGEILRPAPQLSPGAFQETPDQKTGSDTSSTSICMSDFWLWFGIIFFLILLFRKELNAVWDWLSSHNKFGEMVDREKSKKL